MKRKMSIRSSALNEYLDEFKSKVLTGESIKECVEKISEGRKLFLQDLFRRHDKDSSGFICRDELEQCLRDLAVYGSDASLKAGVDTMMHLFDKSGDNKINEEEFIVMLTFTSDVPMSKRELERSFQVFDVNGDGGVDARGLAKALECVGEKLLSKKECSEIVELVDENKDGEITVRSLSLSRCFSKCIYTHKQSRCPSLCHVSSTLEERVCDTRLRF